MAANGFASGCGIDCHWVKRARRRGRHAEGHFADDSSGVLTELAHARQVAVGIWVSLCRRCSFLGEV